jgi:hypothetical protein
MTRSSDPVTRRGAMRIATKTTSMVAMQVIGMAATKYANAQAYGQTPRNVVRYQDSPKDGHDCATCQQFIPGTVAGADGHCKVVAGTVSPQGWCIVWTAKS